MKKFLPALLFCITIFVSCEENEPKPQELEVSTSKISLNSGGNESILATSDFDILYESENEFHATVTSQGEVTAVKVGSTNIIVTSNSKVESVEVEVLPLYNTYPTPIIDWSMTVNKIISVIGQPDAISDGVLGYGEYSPKAPVVMYKFDENEKLSSTAVMVNTEYSSELGSFMEERYQYAGESDGFFIFADALEPSRAKLIVAASQYDTDFWMVIYTPFIESELKSSQELYSSFFKTIKSIKEELK